MSDDLDVHDGAHFVAPLYPGYTFSIDVEHATHAFRSRGHPYALAGRVCGLPRLQDRCKALPVCPQCIPLLRFEDERAAGNQMRWGFCSHRVRVDRPGARRAIPEGVNSCLSRISDAEEPHLWLRIWERCRISVMRAHRKYTYPMRAHSKPR